MRPPPLYAPIHSPLQKKIEVARPHGASNPGESNLSTPFLLMSPPRGGTWEARGRLLSRVLRKRSPLHAPLCLPSCLSSCLCCRSDFIPLMVAAKPRHLRLLPRFGGEWRCWVHSLPLPGWFETCLGCSSENEWGHVAMGALTVAALVILKSPRPQQWRPMHDVIMQGITRWGHNTCLMSGAGKAMSLLLLMTMNCLESCSRTALTTGKGPGTRWMGNCPNRVFKREQATALVYFQIIAFNSKCKWYRGATCGNIFLLSIHETVDSSKHYWTPIPIMPMTRLSLSANESFLEKKQTVES